MFFASLFRWEIMLGPPDVAARKAIDAIQVLYRVSYSFVV
jgi:hypothetical protein